MTQDQTTTNLQNGTFLTPVIAFTMLIGVGTGGQYTLGYHEARKDKCVFCRPHDDAKSAPKAAIVAEIEYIKFNLDLTLTELARCLGVSRQAPYNWMAGGMIKPENAAKISNLKAAADVIATANIESRPLFMQRKLPGGKTLMESIVTGEDAREAARSLVEIYRSEAEQRKILADHFAGRRTST
jgi:DNA-binding transcriptional regulator YiaG